MSSIIEICNDGLLLVGEETVTSVFPPDEGSKEARLCNQFYNRTVDEVLRMHDWNCAKHTKIIAVDATFDEDEFDYSYEYRYQLPSNPWCLKVRTFNDGKTKYDIQGRFLYSDVDSCELVYTKRITDVTEFDSLLIEAISVKLAVKLTFPLKQSKTLRAELIEYLVKDVLLRAKGADADEKYDADAAGEHSWRNAGR